MKYFFCQIFLLVHVFLICQIFSSAIAQEPELVIPVGHKTDISCHTFSNDKKYIVTGGEDGNVKVWEAATGRLLISLGNHSEAIINVAFTPDNRYIIAATLEWRTVVYDISSGKLKYELREMFDQKIIDIEFINNNEEVIFDTEWGPCFLYSLPEFEFLKTIRPKNFCGELSYGPNADFFINLRNDDRYELLSGKGLKRIKIFDQYDENLDYEFSLDKKFILLSFEQSGFKIFNTNKGELVYHMPYGDASCIYNVSSKRCESGKFSPDGKYCCAIVDTNLHIVRLNKEQSEGILMMVIDSVENFFYTPDGSALVTISTDRILKVLDITMGRVLLKVNDFRYSEELYVSFDERNNNLIICNSVKVQIFAVPSYQIISESLLKTSDDPDITINDNILFIDQFDVIKYQGLGYLVHLYPEIYDAYTGRKIASLEGAVQLNLKNSFASDSTIIFSDYSSSDALWDLRSGSLLHYLDFYEESYRGAVFSSDNQSLLRPYSENSAIVWDIVSGTTKYIIHNQRYISDIEFNRTGDKFSIVGGGSGDNPYVEVYDTKSGDLLNRLEPECTDITDGEFNPINNTYVLTTNYYIILYDLIKNTTLYTKIITPDTTNCADWCPVATVRFSPGGKYIISEDVYRNFRIWESASGADILKEKTGKNNFTYCDVSHDDKYILFGEKDQSFSVYDLSNMKCIVKDHIKCLSIKSAKFLNTSDDLMFVIEKDNCDNLVVYHVADRKIENRGRISGMGSAQNNNNDQLTLSRTIYSVEIKKDTNNISCYKFKGNNYLILAQDKYYKSSKNASRELYWRIGQNLYSFDQFDLQYNRPDIILDRLGMADSLMINAYYLAYLKRLKMMKFTEDMLGDEVQVPEVEILNVDSIPQITKTSTINFEIRAVDKKFRLDRINIWINDVPAFGMDGIDLRTFRVDSIKREIQIDLSGGENRIQVSCLNEKGVESLRESFWITYLPEKPVEPKQYLIAISVSEYQNSLFNLKYAVKDGRDMAILFAGKNAFVDTLFNQNATRENILALKQKLMQTNVDDEVILYISGHGLLDKNYDFYFATYDMNFENPAEKGILYEDLEGLLDGIPARKKLLLMDACHSGEVDKDAPEAQEAVADLGEGMTGKVKAVVPRGIIITGIEHSGLGLQNSFELMQELFANLTRGSGAVVISAASGTGYALESEEWNNGIFTYCVLKGLGEMKADTNNDKTVTVSELKDYVSKEVERLTNGAQKPTSRRESLEFDWKVW